MSQSPLTPDLTPKVKGEQAAARVSAQHYQALCGLALSAIILLQLQQSTLLPQVSLAVAILLGCIGVIAIFYRSRMRPMLVLLAMAVPHVIEQYYLNIASSPDSRAVRFLDLADVMMCIATLAYFIGHYRLHGLWFGVLPPDSRLALLPSLSGRGVGGEGTDKQSPPRVRSEESLSAAELVTLVFSVPLFALLAQFAFLLLKQQWTGIELPPRWRQFLVTAWILLLVMFLAAHAFRYWRRLQMDRVSALLMLQDILWNETRGEQRRLNRWIAWAKLKLRKKAD
jgi:hypothetical protein